MARARKEARQVEEGEVTSTYDEALVAGYFGEKQDPEPNETYTATGDPQAKARADAREKGVPEVDARPADQLTGTPES